MYQLDTKYVCLRCQIESSEICYTNTKQLRTFKIQNIFSHFFGKIQINKYFVNFDKDL